MITVGGVTNTGDGN